MFGLPQLIETPVQIYQLDENFSCQTALPAADLRGIVHYYWKLTIPDGRHDLQVIPDNSVDLVLSPEFTEFSIVYCPVTKPFQIELIGPINYIGICIPAGRAAQLFQRSISQLRELTPGIETTTQLDTAILSNSLSPLNELDEMSHFLDSYLRHRLNGIDRAQESANSLDPDLCLRSMESALGESGVTDVARQLGFSERQFRREMSRQFGFGPKKVQRVVRLQAALRELFAQDVAGAEDGYYDDSHRIREIRALTGLTPSQIRRLAEIYNSQV